MTNDKLKKVADTSYGRPHYKETKNAGFDEIVQCVAFVEIEGQTFLVAQHKKDGPKAVYSEDGTNHWFGGPHHKIEGFTAGKFLIAQHKEHDDWAFYSKNGKNNWFGGPHYSFSKKTDMHRDWLHCITDIEEGGLLLAQHQAFGLFAVYSEDGKNDWFGGPFSGPISFIEVDGVKYVADHVDNEELYDYFLCAYSIDGFCFHNP